MQKIAHYPTSSLCLRYWMSNTVATKPKTCDNCKHQYSACLQTGIVNLRQINPNTIVIIGACPLLYDVTKSVAFQTEEEKVIQQLIDQAVKPTSVNTIYTYAIRVPILHPSVDALKKCKVLLHRELQHITALAKKPPIIIALGQTPLRALDYNVEKISPLYGKRIQISIPAPIPEGMQQFTVFVAPSVEFFTKNPGISWMYSAVAKHAAAAASNTAAEETLKELTAAYQYPKTKEELDKLVDHIIGYYNPERSSNNDPSKWWISIDTETTGLYPQWLQEPKVTMLSIAWDDGKSAVIKIEGMDYTEKDAWNAISRLLSCPKPKVFHNWKFDLKFLELVHGVYVNNVCWDSMLGEHYLDEDKKGFYGLKKLVPFYLPNYQGYEANIRFDGEIEQSEEPRTTFTKAQLLEKAKRAEEANIPVLEQPVSFWKNVKELILAKRLQELRQLLKLHGLELIATPKKNKKAAATPISEMLQYAAIDADVTRQIARKQLLRVTQEGLYQTAHDVMSRLYLPASRVLGKMEFRGVKVNHEQLEQMIQSASARLESLRTEIKVNYDPLLNINSPQQVALYMAKANFPQIEESYTNKDVLNVYLDTLSEDDPRRRFCELLLDYREVHKTLFTYLIPLRDYAAKNGRIHCNFHLNGTATGRLSSSDPNMQNIPKITARRVDKQGNIVHPGYNIKSIFVPSSPDMYIVNVDIKAAELRTYTAYSNDKTMINILLSGQDPHSWVTAKVFGISYEEVVQKRDTDPEIKKMRTNCKRIIFGTLYGAGPSKISKIIKIPIEEAQSLQQQIFSVLPALPDYIQKVKTRISSKRQLLTYFGRCRRFPTAAYSSKHAADALREGVNFLIQSTSSDLVLSAMCNLDKAIDDIGGHLLFPVHDSIVMEIPKDKINLLPAILEERIVEYIKKSFPWLPVPFLFDMEYGENYGELKETTIPEI